MLHPQAHHIRTHKIQPSDLLQSDIDGALLGMMSQKDNIGFPTNGRLLKHGLNGNIGLSQNLRSEEHTSELRHVAISYAVFCLKKKKKAECSQEGNQHV